METQVDLGVTKVPVVFSASKHNEWLEIILIIVVVKWRACPHAITVNFNGQFPVSRNIHFK